MGLLNKIGKIITAPAKVISNIVQKNPIVSAAEKVLPTKVKEAIAGIHPLKGAIAGITPGGVKGAIAGISPIAKPIVSAVNKVLPPQVTKEINRIAPDVAKGNPIVGGVKIPMQGFKQKGKLVDPDFNIFRKKKIPPMKRGGLVGSSSSRAEGAMKKGGSSASSRADGIAQRGKTRGRMV